MSYKTTLLLVIILIISGIFPEIVSSSDGNPVSNLIGTGANVIMAAASVANLIIICIFYRNDKRSRQEQQKYLNKLYWLQKIILDRNIDMIIQFSDKCIGIITQCQNIKNTPSTKDDSKQVRGLVFSYNKEKSNLERSVANLLKVIDKKRGDQISSLLEKHQNSFTTQLVNAFGEKDHCTFLGCRNLVYQHQEELLTVFYEIQESA